MEPDQNSVPAAVTVSAGKLWRSCMMELKRVLEAQASERDAVFEVVRTTVKKRLLHLSQSLQFGVLLLLEGRHEPRVGEVVVRVLGMLLEDAFKVVASPL